MPWALQRRHRRRPETAHRTRPPRRPAFDTGIHLIRTLPRTTDGSPLHPAGDLPMDLRKLKTLIDLVSESNISELEITEADGKVRIVKSDPPAQALAYAVPPPSMPAPPGCNDRARHPPDAGAATAAVAGAAGDASGPVDSTGPMKR